MDIEERGWKKIYRDFFENWVNGLDPFYDKIDEAELLTKDDKEFGLEKEEQSEDSENSEILRRKRKEEKCWMDKPEEPDSDDCCQTG